MYINTKICKDSVMYLNSETLYSNENEQTIHINNK